MGFTGPRWPSRVSPYLPLTVLFIKVNFLFRFLHHELGWKQLKVDELLLPIIQKMNKRGQAAALNRQGNLNEFLDISAGSGTHAPRKGRTYESKRLQQVISEFRKRTRQGSGSSTPAPASEHGDDNSQDESEDILEGTSRKRQRTPRSSTVTGERESAVKKGRTTVSSTSRGNEKAGSRSVARGNGRGRGRGRGGTRIRARKSKAQESSSEVSEESVNEDRDSDVFVPAPTQDAVAGENGEVNLRPRPRPRPTYKAARGPVVGVTGGEESALNVAPDVLPETALRD